MGIAVPNGTAVFLNLSRTAYVQATALAQDSSRTKSRGKETVFADTSDGISWTEHMAASVVFGFTALEAFSNEMIPEDFVWFEASAHDLHFDEPERSVDEMRRIAREVLDRGASEREEGSP